MAHIIVIGAGIGGVSCAFGLREWLGRKHRVTLVGSSPHFEFCLADFGDTGAAFAALPQIPPRNVTWTRTGKWVHLAKIAFEKYFLRKVRTGSVTPVYERYVLRLLGIRSLKSNDDHPDAKAS